MQLVGRLLLQQGHGRPHFIMFPWPCTSSPHSPSESSSHPKLECSPRSHISSTKMCLLAVWKAWSSADLMVAVEPEQWLQISSRPFSHAPFLWTKGNYLKSYLFSLLSGYRESNSFSSRRRCWIWPPGRFRTLL